MALEFINDAERNLLSDFMCDNIVLDVHPDELNFPSCGDIFSQIDEDLGILHNSMDVSPVNDVLKYNYKNGDIETPEISEFLNIKQEPLSPSSASSSSSSRNSPINTDRWNNMVNDLLGDWNRLETPPTTPPNNSDSSPPVSPTASNSSSDEIKSNLSPQNIPNSGLFTNSQILFPKVGPQKINNVCPKTTSLTVLPCVTQSVSNAAITSPLPITVSSLISPLNQDIDMRAFKRQQRMIKNRESANLSRKKKREYVQSLEAEIKQISEVNQRLKLENGQLFVRVRELEKENRSLRLMQHPVSVKKVTALFAIVCMITLNLGPLSGIFLTNKLRVDDIQNSIATHHSRSLLWSVENDDLLNINLSGEQNFTETYDENNTKLHSICPMFINKTESLRLENELRGWVFGSEDEDKLSVPFKRPLKKNLPPTLRLRNQLKSYPDKKSSNQIGDFNNNPDSNGLQIYQSPTYNYDAFLKAFKQRDDTFYVVSFTGDHLLLPARAHNKTRRPQMSLILPALPLNDSVRPPKDRVAMMQIDCEVMNTKVVYVKESLIPSHVKRQNGTSFQTPNSKSTKNV